MLALKIFIAELITHSLVGKIIYFFTNGKFSQNGVKYEFDLSLVNPRSIAQIKWNIYESSEIKFIKKYINNIDCDFIELGGSLGVVSTILMRQKPAHKKGIVVEANPNLIGTIKNNIGINNIQNVVVLNAAIPIKNESSVTFNFGSDTTVGNIVDSEINSTSIEVETIKLSKIIADNKIENYVLVSDIEGAEIGLFFNDKDTVALANLIIIELHDIKIEGVEYNVDYMVSQIKNLGFNCLDRHGNVFVFKKN